MIRPILFSILCACALLSFSCSTDGGPEADFTSIVDPRARWEAYKFTDYTIEQILDCFCPYGGLPIRVEVRNRQIFNVTRATNGSRLSDVYWSQFRTIEGLFDEAEAVNPDSVSAFSVEYDARYGFPTMIYVDPNSMIADEEYGFRTGAFDRQ